MPRKYTRTVQNNVSTKFFSDFVLKRRKELGLTQADLSKALGRTQTYAARLEAGTFINFNKVDIDGLASVLKTSAKGLRSLLLGVEFVSDMDDKDILSLIQAIASSEIGSITMQEFVSLLKIESSLAVQSIGLTRDMIPSLLQQIRR